MSQPNGHPRVPSQTRVVVAMSGGVDSSVAAALLVEQGYDVVGMMLRLWSEPGQETFNRCCTPDQMADARRIAAQLQIPFYAIDVKDYFRKTIVQFFIDEYAAGRTPNPCLECNRHIRFRFLLDHALALDADYLATGHYARVRRTPDGAELWRGVDAHKDQSYVLHVLTQEQLGYAMFPIGEYEKATVREIAAAHNLISARRSDSQDLCFLGDGSYREFLGRNAPDVGVPGDIVSTSGDVVGQHDGLPFYTIGQRRGLGVSASIPLYVVGKDSATNTLLVGAREEVGRREIAVRRVNWIAGEAPLRPIRAHVKIRYKSAALPASVSALDDTIATVQFDDAVFGVAPGQGAVFYDGDRCLGGGLIAE